MSAPIVLAFETAWQAMPPELGKPDAIYAHPATHHALLRETWAHQQLTHEGGFDRFAGVVLLNDRWAPEGEFFPAWDRMLPVYQRRMLSAARGARIDTASLASTIESLERARVTAPSREKLIEVWAYILEMFAREAVRVKP